MIQKSIALLVWQVSGALVAHTFHRGGHTSGVRGRFVFWLRTVRTQGEARGSAQ